MNIRSLLAVGVLGFAVSAHADSLYNFTASGSGITSSGTITVRYVAGKYEITGITGTYADSVNQAFSGPITSLFPSSYDSNSSDLTPDGKIAYDNLFYPVPTPVTCYGLTTTANLDLCGVAFMVSAGSSTHEIAFYGSPYGYNNFLALEYTVGQGYGQQDAPIAITLTDATTPEPSTFALLGTGLLGVAGAVRKRLA